MATLADLVIKLTIKDAGLAAKIKKTETNLKSLDDKTSNSLKMMATLGPALLPVLGSAAVGIGGMGVALGAAGAAAGVFGAVTKSAFSEIQDGSSKTEDLRKKISLLGTQIDVANKTGFGDAGKLQKSQESAMNELMARYKQFPPAQRAVIESYDGMKTAWGAFVDQNKPAVYGLITRGTTLISKNVGILQPLFDVVASRAKNLMAWLEKTFNSGGPQRFVTFLASYAGPSIDKLAAIVKNVGSVIGRFFLNSATAGQGMLGWLVQVTDKWAAWSKETSGGGLDTFMSNITSKGPQVFTLLSQLAGAAVTIAKAVTPLAPISLAIATGLAALVAAIPPAFITALVAGFIAFSAAMKVYSVVGAIVTAVQWAQNAAFLASPITWVVLAVIALGIVIYALATKTQFFQTIWSGVWGFLKMVGAWFAGPFTNFFVAAYNKFIEGAMQAWHGIVAAWNGVKAASVAVKNALGAAVNWVVSKWQSMVNSLLNAKNRVSTGLSRMWDGLKNGFRSAINYVIGKWNSLHFTIPSFSILGKSFGGGTIGVPNIPQLANGGLVKARAGGTLVNVGEGGRDEAVVPLNRAPDLTHSREAAPAPVLVIEGAETAFRTWLKKSIRVKGQIVGIA